MRTLLFMSAVFVTTVMLGQRPSQAYGDAPWCAIMQIGTGSVVERCEYQSIETCRPEVIMGNRGFCNPNPRYRGPTSSRPSKRKRSTY